MIKTLTYPVIFLMLCSLSLPVSAQLKLAKIFSSEMMIQRGETVPVWGWSTPGTEVVLRWDDSPPFHTITSKQGEWEIKLPPTTKKGPHRMEVRSGSENVIVENIIAGDIWLCAGQSNMEWMVENSNQAEIELARAEYPEIRLFDVPHKMANLPAKDLPGEPVWHPCRKESVRQFSAVGYFFGRDLHEKLGLPIGLISDNFGGTIIQTWMSPEGFAGLVNYEKDIAALPEVDFEADKREGHDEFNVWLRAFHDRDKGISDEQYVWANTDYSDWKSMDLPGIWEASGDTSLFERDGVVWFAKDFYVEEIPAGVDQKLSLGPIDDSDMTWINGTLVGQMENRYNKDRWYTIPPGVLKTGKNTLVVRVEDYIGGGGLYGDPEQLFVRIGEEIIPLAGRWKYKVGMLTDTPMPKNNFGPNGYPCVLYNGMIAPITRFPIKGVIWYQGESNVYKAVEYRDLLQRWVRDWRSRWHAPDMPFLWVQLANFGPVQETPKPSMWAELREAQEAGLALPHTGMITAIDIGEGKNIHPRNKQEVGRRLALAAEKEVYGLPVKYYGPHKRSATFGDNYVDIRFDSVYGGLYVTNRYGCAHGFSIAGADRVFHWARAYVVDAQTVRVFAPEGKAPVSVRYAWEDNPFDLNLFNSEGFPALPFRTDDWPLSTGK